MSMTLVIVVAAAVFLLLLVGVAVIFFVLKSKGKKSGESAHQPQMQAPAGQQGFGAPDAAAPASWPPPQPAPQQQWGEPQWGAPPAPEAPPAPAWPSPPEAPTAPPPPAPGFAPSAAPDPYATTPSVDVPEPMPNADLFMTTPNAPRQTSGDVTPAHLRADDGSIIQLNRVSLRVGRHPECDIVIPTPGTSRQHAEFEFRDGAWVINDLNSGNGTFVNNVRVRTQPLAPGDEIRIDQTRFTFSPGA
jgi:hypothetical protein